jgi:flavin-binding protein dodecin
MRKPALFPNLFFHMKRSEIVALSNTSDAIFGKAALSIFESLALALLDNAVLDERTVQELLEDAADSHRHALALSPSMAQEIEAANRIDRLLQSILTIHQYRNNNSPPYLRDPHSKPPGKGEYDMSDNIYSVTELVGSSSVSIEDAIEKAVTRASQTIRNLDWFETKEIRGHIKDDKVIHYQVVLKIGFRYED